MPALISVSRGAPAPALLAQVMRHALAGPHWFAWVALWLIEQPWKSVCTQFSRDNGIPSCHRARLQDRKKTSSVRLRVTIA
jgi:hypothetical protein